MHYYIDGYNMLFRMVHSTDRLQQHRSEFISSLNQQIALLGYDVTLVFDAQYQIGDSTQSHFQHIEILFSAHGETADDLIIQELLYSKNPRQETVVTCDRGLARRVKGCQAHVESIHDFLDRLHRCYKKKLRIPQENKTPKQLFKSYHQQTLAETSVTSQPIQTPEMYYQMVFEAKSKILEQEEEREKLKKRELKKGTPKKLPKKPPQDPFAEPETEEVKSTNEFDRWLVLFENSKKPPAR